MSSEQNISFLHRQEWFQSLAKGNSKSQWQPIPSLLWTVIFFVVLTLVGLPLGGSLLYASSLNISFTYRYDDFGGQSFTAEQRKSMIQLNGRQQPVSMITDHKMSSPVYVYYELTNYFQNHKRYVRSVSEEQMGGNNPDISTISECDPYRYLPRRQESEQREPIVPCGLIAHSYFNDTFTLIESTDHKDRPLGLRMEETDIATEWDRKYLYSDEVQPENFNLNNTYYQRGGGAINGTSLKDDEHFMVWMRIGSKPTIRKLYGIIHSDIPSGANLTFEIEHNYNTYDFNGKKKLILTTSNWTGGRNEFIGIVYLVIGSLSAVACIVTLIRDMICNRRRGDLRELSWNKDLN